MQTTPVLNPSPKTRFQESANNVSEHARMIELNAFRRGADFAMLQYQTLCAGQIRDTNSALAASFKLQGALEFMQTFILLGSNESVTPRSVSDNLTNC